MLQLTIPYESKWGNSFLEGNNNEPLPVKGRKYLASLSGLNAKDGEKNFIRRHITTDTVMGVLNRLIGDRRKLYQSRKEAHYFFGDIENQKLVTFDDRVSVETQEMIYLRNLSNSTDQNSFSGMVKADHPAFSQDLGCEFWGVLFLPLESMCNFVLQATEVTEKRTLCPISVASQFNTVVSKISNMKIDQEASPLFNLVLQTEAFLSKHFNANYRNKAGTSIVPSALYCSALYLQFERLSTRYDMEPVRASRGGIPGFSKKGFTFKDFMSTFTTGNGKLIYGNPYYRETSEKGVGTMRELLTKSSGRLLINLDVTDEKAREIIEMIKNAGVMSFPLGKKGLAYVDSMRII